MAVFVWLATYGSALTVKPGVVVIPADQYGSNKERRVQIEPTRREWSLSFENRPNATADSIEAFFEARNGTESFTWVPPHGPVGTWVCREWSVSPTSPSTRTVNATFMEVHGEV